MYFCKTYKKYRDRWWALPLALPLVLLPIIKLANTYAWIDGGKVSLYYLPLPFMLCLMLFFGWKAVPGIAAATWIYLSRDVTFYEKIGIVLHFIIPLVLAWGGYRIFIPRRQMVSHGDSGLMAHRLFWQMFFPATVFQLLFQFAIYVGLYPSRSEFQWVSPLTLRSLINYQSLLVSCLTGVPFCYMLIRLARNPCYIRGLISQMRLDFDPKVKWGEVVVWVAALTTLLVLLLMPLTSQSTIFSTNYTLSLLLPVALWGAMRFGYRFIAPLWTLLLIIAIHFHYHYLPIHPGYSTQLAITSSSYLVFSFIIAYIAVLSTRERTIHARVRRMAFLDPVVHLPNLRALNRAIDTAPWSVVCFLRMPDLEVLGRHYGVMLRINYKQKMAEWLSSMLRPGEDVYQLSGHDLALRLNTEDYQQHIARVDARVKQFRYLWNGMPLQPQVGMSYCYIHSPVSHLSLLLGELSTIADLSLISQHPENLQRRGALHLQQELKDKVAMMLRVQQALESDRFCLMAQPIIGIRGDDYHEVLLRMIGDDGELISPNEFLPVAHEFGMASRIDLWVLENTLHFMDKCREHHPGMRLSVNLSPSTACGSEFSQQVADLLAKYNIEAWQLIFEVTESHSLSNPDQARHTLSVLQDMGCRVAIDDFGTGYASYARLKHVNADILKIDGSFIRNIATSSLDYQIVVSICHLARMKNMRVVAEYVESEEIRKTAIELGIDYLQGYCIGKPAPLETLVAEPVARLPGSDFR
ncbi:sensor domain-containing phosphodiesterase [Pseudocitrobacter cyperus]|uniref:EAL domain-containing protein n=1 Tax=Pseudocitrobacter cyperus TaxID=3112843 RepID=A0ABV0HNS8_9ENTR